MHYRRIATLVIISALRLTINGTVLSTLAIVEKNDRISPRKQNQFFTLTGKYTVIRTSNRVDTIFSEIFNYVDTVLTILK